MSWGQSSCCRDIEKTWGNSLKVTIETEKKRRMTKAVSDVKKKSQQQTSCPRQRPCHGNISSQSFGVAKDVVGPTMSCGLESRKTNIATGFVPCFHPWQPGVIGGWEGILWLSRVCGAGSTGGEQGQESAQAALSGDLDNEQHSVWRTRDWRSGLGSGSRNDRRGNGQFCGTMGIGDFMVGPPGGQGSRV